jgi:hypothetical protein
LKGISEEMKAEKVMRVIHEAWNEVCRGASNFVNSNQVVKIYLSFLFNLMLDIFDNFHCGNIQKNQLCAKTLEERVWIWFQWRCDKITNADFLK